MDFNITKLDTSMFTFYSIGIVAKDKEWNSYIIEVIPIEHIPDYTIDASEKKEDNKNVKHVKEVTTSGKSVSATTTVKVEARPTIEARWLSIGEYNRLTAPNVRKGEQVLLFRYSNTDLFFWTTSINDITLRKEERIVYAISVKPKVNDKEKLDEMYYLEIDTKEKKILLHTTAKYGEFTTYDLTIDTKQGKIELKDGVGNYVLLDSSNDLLEANINKKVHIKTKDVLVEASNSVTFKTKEYLIDASSSTTIKTGKFKVQSSKAEIN